MVGMCRLLLETQRSGYQYTQSTPLVEQDQYTDFHTLSSSLPANAAYRLQVQGYPRIHAFTFSQSAIREVIQYSAVVQRRIKEVFT
ncbi:hypothetical protein CFIMG_003541RAa [Ceratocystis fimbriata CBS 114723]|uniref:Uncharacterized protein n=1 Tax=Ceratocystis fimbriata CBS 114723 TaxID=1035309 RepID=A0A2C5X3E6_9PEZI|nr:hypothetical protein CFIMG_003541RAa [Ceratocystis fimbriata CBS 114723]